MAIHQNIQSEYKAVAAVELIGPDEAAKLLGANTHNRHLRSTIVERLARAMAQGEWDLNGESIKVSTSGALIDGQHRLAAVVEAKATIPFVVVRGLNAPVQETVDIGERRSLSDVLSLRGEKDTNVLAAALRVAWQLSTNGHLWNGIGYAYPTTRELLRYLDENPGIRESLPPGNRANHADIRYPASTAAGLHYIMSQLDAEDAEDFWDKLVTGAGMESGAAILTLRQYLIRDLAAQRRMDGIRRAAVTIKTWNAYRAGKSMFQVRWSRGGKNAEAFPVIE